MRELEYEIFNFKGEKIKRKPVRIEWNLETAKKEGYKHYMRKEIQEDYLAAKNALNVNEEKIERVAKLLLEHKFVYLTGMGTSLHAAMIGSYWLDSTNQKSSKRIYQTIDSSELPFKYLDEDYLVLALTQSGETKETLDALKYARSKGAKTVTIVNVPNSSATFPEYSNECILQGSGPEIAVCATKTFIGQLTILARLAEKLDEWQKDERWELEKIPIFIKNVLKKEPEIRKKTQEFCKTQMYFMVGNGINYPSAKEFALKFKEITYMEAEAMTSGFFKHGTLSLIDERFRVFGLISPNSKKAELMKHHLEEIKARKGKILSIGFDKECELYFELEIEERLSPFPFAVVGQLIAYHYADLLRREIDKPRHLAKSVTVF